MCGRYTITVDEEELVRFYALEAIRFPYRPRYNVAPGQAIPAIIRGDGGNRAGLLKWGLIPNWADDPKIANRLINARSESVLDKPAFRVPFLRKRCVIPADGYYDWKPTPDGKQPMRIQAADSKLFSMAAVYDTWIDPNGEKVHTCAIITTEANVATTSVHPRMPAILRPEDVDRWLDRGNQDVEWLLSALRPYPAERISMYAVHPRVGNVKNDDEACVLPLASSSV